MVILIDIQQNTFVSVIHLRYRNIRNNSSISAKKNLLREILRRMIHNKDYSA
jgi:hypothetical protein